MQMIRKNHHGIDVERVVLFHLMNGMPEKIDMFGQVPLVSVVQVDGEKVGCSREPVSSVLHCPSLDFAR